MLENKKVLLAVCGSIAAYKTAFFVRLLVKAGAEVKVVITKSATNFITPLTLATLSKNPVLSDFYKNNTGEWNNHVELGLWADLMIVAPASANTLAKMANGACDNLLLATYLSARCPVMVAPAMDLDMYHHPSTTNNLATLKAQGVNVIDAEEGELASGLNGEGRMAEPETLLEKIKSYFESSISLTGKTVLMTSGPTHEAIDPVRFIGNHSTGKMGKAIAEELASRGASVKFISGPVARYPHHKNIEIFKVTSADQMYTQARELFHSCDIAIFAAAVADYKPSTAQDKKIKKQESSLSIDLVPNPDIAKLLGELKKDQYTVGFALETDQEETNAQYKLEKKNLDLIVLNSLNHSGAGFAHDTNKVSFYDSDNNVMHFELKSKTEVAMDLIDYIQKQVV